MKYIIDFVALLAIYFLFYGLNRKKAGHRTMWINTIFYIYLSFVVFFTLMPILTSLPYIFSHPYQTMNLVPFIDVLNHYGDYIRQIVLNILLFIPAGFLYPLTRKHKSPFSSTVLFCFLFSFCIEMIQPLLNSYRSSDVTDVLTNVLGGIIGYVLFRLLKPAVLQLLEKLFPEK